MEHKVKKSAYISIQELATILGISRVAVFKRVKKGQIPAQKIGRSYVVSVEDVEDIVGGSSSGILTDEKKGEINHAIKKVVKEYGETLRLLGKE